MRNTCNRFGYETLALIPIRSGDRTLGLIHVADREANRLDDNTIKILESAALQLGTAIERVQAEEALKDSHNNLEKQVDKRTQMLVRAKNELVLEVEQREKYEKELLGFQQRLRKLSSKLIQTEERERRRIATEIHDRIGQALAVIKIQLGVIQAEFDFQDLKPKVEYVRELISQTIRDVRTLTFELSPPMLYELGLQAALEWLAVSLRKQSGLEVEVAADDCDQLLDTDRRVLLFRTCRELLFNVVKHADAQHARVDIHSDGDLIRVEISDDGVGFDQAVLQNGFDPFERGFGLFSIGEQLQQYGGTFTVDPAPDRGSVVTVALPRAMTTEPEKGVSS
jgi:signal transduction histidine kinase